jgi:ATP-dependent DNA helicase PIF1
MKMQNDERCIEFFFLKRCVTKCLIIDEVSMISSKTLVEFILRKIKQCTKYFGGIQVILCGDFFQLPPVANELYRDTG